MFHVWWPASAILALFVVVVIILVLRYADQWCGARHTAQPANGEYASAEDMEMVTYDQSVEKEYSVWTSLWNFLPYF